MPHVPHPPHAVACASTHVPAGPRDHAVRFGSPAELAAATRHDRLARTGPLLVAARAGFQPDGPWPGSALESAENVLATRPSTMIEIDLRATHDGGCVVLHDAVMGRSSTGAGPVGEQSADYVLSQRLIDDHGEITSYRVREAGEFLAWAVRAGAVLWLDVHDVAPEAVVGLVREHGAQAQVVVGTRGMRDLAVYRRLAPDLVYFVPTHPDGLPTAEDVRRQVPDPERVIGFAGEYVPDPQACLRLRSWNVPTLLNLARYDETLRDHEIDARFYRRAVGTGNLILRTTHYREVADLLGHTGWAGAGARLHDQVR